MKFIAFLFAFAIAPVAFAKISVQGHWTAKSMTCSSGAVANPGFPADARADFHFYDDGKFEEVLMRTDQWMVARGDYNNTDTQICFDTREVIVPKRPPYQLPSRPNCWDFQVTAKELVLQMPPSSDCPPGDNVSLHLELMAPL